MFACRRGVRRICIGRGFSTNSSKAYDLAVIGGGSGGLACAREAVRCSTGKKIAVIDYVAPSPHGAKWGLGGCCVNVGCIPKKLMHHAALLKQFSTDSKVFGWTGPDGNDIIVQHDWSKLVDNVQNVIRGMNWGYRAALKDEGIDYYNAKASFIDDHTLKLEAHNKPANTITASNFLIAVGGRPKYLDIPGAELAITSDDLFSLSSPPGKTLLIGGGYVALECAGFLTEFGYDVSVMVRGPILRGFDQQMAGFIHDNLQAAGTKFIRRANPVEIKQSSDGKLEVEWREGEEGKRVIDRYDTVVMATGRIPSTAQLQLNNVNVSLDSDTRKILTDDRDATTNQRIFAIGDVAYKRPELTPPAIKAGQLLARRLFQGSSKLMNYDNIATTIFTPLEYGCVGLSEEEAISRHGDNGIEILHAKYDTLELQASHRMDHEGKPLNAICYTKVIYKRGVCSDKDRVIGVHVFGPNAGEAVQGFSLAVKLGVTREDMEDLVSIHPTHAEEVLLLSKSKSKKEDPTKKGC